MMVMITSAMMNVLDSGCGWIECQLLKVQTLNEDVENLSMLNRCIIKMILSTGSDVKVLAKSCFLLHSI